MKKFSWRLPKIGSVGWASQHVNKATPEILAEIPGIASWSWRKIPWFQGTTVAWHPPWRRSPHPSLERWSVINSTGEANWLLVSTWTLCILHMYICIYIPTDRDVRSDQNRPWCAFLHVAGCDEGEKNTAHLPCITSNMLGSPQYSTNKGRVFRTFILPEVTDAHEIYAHSFASICRAQSCLLCCQPEPSLHLSTYWTCNLVVCYSHSWKSKTWSLISSEDSSGPERKTSLTDLYLAKLNQPAWGCHFVFLHQLSPSKRWPPTSQYCQGWTIGQLVAFQSAALW